MVTVAPSDNYTEATRWFAEECLNREPGTLNGGIYANKAGYHNKRINLPPTDYSVKLPQDKLGPGNKAAGFDWTFSAAQAGDYSRITFYTKAIEAAFWARSPLLLGWREFLGCLNGVTIGFDFTSWQTRKPDSTHKWHTHLSELRENLESMTTKRNMLQILFGGDDSMGVFCKLGDKGDNTAALQGLLQLFDPTIVADGNYGAKTQTALATVLAQVNWPVDGSLYLAGEYAHLQVAVARMFGSGQPGPAGPAGPAGPTGPPGKNATLSEGSVLVVQTLP